MEVDVVGKVFPSFNIFGLPNKAFDEAKDRVCTAIANTSLEMPDSRLIINQIPADIPKEGSGFDLQITIGILPAYGSIHRESLKKSLFIGELSLEGEVRPVPGIFTIALLPRHKKIKRLQHIPFLLC